MAPVSTSHDGVMWVHSNLLEDEQWTKITSKKKKTRVVKKNLSRNIIPSTQDTGESQANSSLTQKRNKLF